jgi:hypothetical protein
VRWQGRIHVFSAQIAAFEEAVNDEDSPLVESDRAAVLSLCGMDQTELQIYTKMMEVYD